MTFLMTWREWLAMKESNARKRAVKAALNGTGVPLPGSYAACPSTNPQAMDSAQETGVVKKRNRPLKVETAQKPDYSFDRWIKMAQDLGNDVNALVGHGKDEEEKIDKAKKDKEKSPPEPKTDTPPSSDHDQDDSERKDTWSQLKKIHRDRIKELQKEPDGKKSGGSQKDSPTSPSKKPS